jgi:hypothetical protein
VAVALLPAAGVLDPPAVAAPGPLDPAALALVADDPPAAEAAVVSGLVVAVLAAGAEPAAVPEAEGVAVVAEGVVVLAEGALAGRRLDASLRADSRW